MGTLGKNTIKNIPCISTYQNDRINIPERYLEAFDKYYDRFYFKNIVYEDEDGDDEVDYGFLVRGDGSEEIGTVEEHAFGGHVFVLKEYSNKLMPEDEKLVRIDPYDVFHNMDEEELKSETRIAPLSYGPCFIPFIGPSGKVGWTINLDILNVL